MYNNKISVIMKSILNFSKLAISTLIMSSVFVACSEEITENTVDAQYTANTGNIKTAGQAVDLGLPSGTKWANMNVGATSETDNGILFVWGDVTGTKLMAENVTSYTDVTNLTEASVLFDLYKGEEKVGALYDTTNVVKIAEPKLIDVSGANDAAQARDIIESFVKDKLNDLISKDYQGFLEATFNNDEVDFIIDWDGSQFIERLPDLKTLLKLDHDPTEEDILAYFQKYNYEKTTTLVIDVIGSTEAKYFEAPAANNYTEIKDQFGAVRRKDFTGGDIGNAPKDRLDDKKKNSLNFVPAYNIISDAAHDPATANWGSGWKMPSTAQFVELLAKCDWEFTGSGYKVTGPNGNSIFFPAAGYRYGEKWYGNGNAGYYATGEITGTYHFPSMAEQANGSKGAINGNENMPNMLIFQHGQYNSLDIYNNLSTSYGVSVRPVAK